MSRSQLHTEAVIEADDRVPVIRITRDFAATPTQLMRAHTEPELFARWTGPEGMNSFERRDAWLASGMDSGVNEGYRKLDLLLGDGNV